MSFFSRVRRWLVDGYRLQGEMSRLPRFLFSQARLFFHVARETTSGGYLQRAGALSFATLLTLVPLIAISFSLYAAFGGADAAKVKSATTHLLSSYFLGAAQPDDGTSPSAEMPRVKMDIYLLPLPIVSAGRQPAGGTPPPIITQPWPVMHTDKGPEAPTSRDRISEWSEEIATTVVGLANRATSAKITTVGALFFILACILLFSAIESAFNAIWHVRSSRRFFMKFTVFCTILFIAPLLIGLSVYASSALTLLGGYLRGFGLWARVLSAFAAFVPPFLITSFAYFLVYMIVPHTRVNWRNALFGAIMASILWGVAKYGFGAYVGSMVSYKRLYGSLAAIPIFMVWIFITWLITLFGAGVAYTSQHLGALENKRRRDRDGGIVSTPLALSLVLEVSRRFAENFGPVPAAELAGEAGTSEDEIRDTLTPLVQAHILSLTTSGGFRYQPAKPLENIRLTEVLDAVKEKDSSALVLPSYRALVQQLLGRTRTAEQRELEGVTLRDILAAQSGDE